MPADISSEVTMCEANEALGRAYEPWINGDYPQARTIGDVVLAMAETSAEKKEWTIDPFTCFWVTEGLIAASTLDPSLVETRRND